MALKNRDFVRYGVKFHLNDFKRNEFDAKYTLLYWNYTFKYWVEIAHVSSKKEGLNAVEEMYKSRCRCFA